MLIMGTLQSDLEQDFLKFLLKWYLKCNSTRDMKVKRFAFRIKGQIKPSAILIQESIQERMNIAKFF